ncbi:hypothetical protein Tco_1465194 [Tanacetum coccineum]
MTLASIADKPSKTFDELMSTPIDFSVYIMNDLKITNLTQETLLGPAFKLLKGTCTNFAELEYKFEECYKSLSEKLDWDNPEGGDYPFDPTKPLPLVINGNRQIVPVDYFFNNDLKYLPVKVAYDKHTLWGISHWREKHKTFYAYARGLESNHDVYSTKHILAVTRVEASQEESSTQAPPLLSEPVTAIPKTSTFRATTVPPTIQHQQSTPNPEPTTGPSTNLIPALLYLPSLLGFDHRNRLTNISGDDVSDFATTLRMFTRSMVIQKRHIELQLGIESYQNKINITKPETTRPNIRKRDPYTPHIHTDPQGFIYVDNQGRNMLMRSDKLYKFRDGTLTRLQTSLEDITKNI